MKIETKFNIGDEVWFMCQNKPTVLHVKKIMSESCKDCSIINYIVFNAGRDEWINEAYCFPTKQQLIESL